MNILTRIWINCKSATYTLLIVAGTIVGGILTLISIPLLVLIIIIYVTFSCFKNNEEEKATKEWVDNMRNKTKIWYDEVKEATQKKDP